jgi:hypothetical protein
MVSMGIAPNPQVAFDALTTGAQHGADAAKIKLAQEYALLHANDPAYKDLPQEQKTQAATAYATDFYRQLSPLAGDWAKVQQQGAYNPNSLIDQYTRQLGYNILQHKATLDTIQTLPLSMEQKAQIFERLKPYAAQAAAQGAAPAAPATSTQ